MASTALVVSDQTQADATIDPGEEFSGIVSRLQGLADEQVRRKSIVEERWLEDIRAFHGRYDSTIESTLKLAKQSRAFVKVTRKKTNAWQARLQDLIFPTDDRNWGIQPTPVPSLTKQAMEATRQAQKAAQDATAAHPADPTLDPAGAQQAQQIAQAGQAHADRAGQMQSEIEAAKKAADAMQDVMDDQLVECQYPTHGRAVIQDACRLGTGILKGPISGEHSRGTWKKDEATGQWGYSKEEDPAPVYRRIDPWSYFPDMSAFTPAEAEFEFERHLWTKKDLRRMVREFGFNRDAVTRLLDRERGPVTAPGLSYLTDLRSITGEGESIMGRYVGWEYHGPLEIREVAAIMRAMARGARDTDPDAYMAAMAKADDYEAAADPIDEKRVVIHFCEGEVLKIAPEYALDSGETLYSVFNFEPGEGSIFGYGVPNVMNDSQRAINGGWRMAMDNAALSVGPQIIIDTTMIEPEDGSWKLTPRKIWRIIKSMSPGQTQPFQAVTIPQNIDEILTIVREAHQHADDETALPVMSEGEVPDGPAQTATADRARQVGSNVTFRRVVKDYDDSITTPSMRRLFDWNMQFNPRDDIKGDMSIDARGTSVLLVREIQAQQLLGIVTNWTTHPVIGPMLKPYESVRKTLQAMSVGTDILKSEDDYKTDAAEMAKNAPKDPQQIIAEAQLERAKIEAETAEKVANIHHTTEMMKVAQQHNMSIDQLKAMLVKEDMHIKSKERIFAGEVGAERQMADDAHARGMEPSGSGGYVNGAEKPAGEGQ